MLSLLTVSIIAVVLAWPSPTAAAPAAPEDRILAPEHYTSDKAKTLAVRHGDALRDLNARIYHCMPWVEIQKQSIGFFKPKHATQDDRYLSLRIYVDQEPSPAFAQLAMTERASAMFSRYVGPLLRRMAQPSVVADDSVDGFTVIVEWLKQIPTSAGARPVHETIAVFVQKSAVADFLAGRTSPQDLAGRAVVLGFDGETSLGDLKLAAWDDDFVTTYKVTNYEVAPGVTCP
jgi:hypothetical protein